MLSTFRTMFILLILIILLCAMFKITLDLDAYFNEIKFGILVLGYIIYSLQLISFCIMNAQIFDSTIRATIITFIIYLASFFIYSWAIFWPTGIQYVLIFFSPYIAGHSLFQVSKMYPIR